MPVKCRKCNGDHFTSNCGKEKVSKISKENNNDKKSDDRKPDYKKSDDRKSNHNKSNHNKSNHNKSNHNKSNHNKSNYNKSNNNKKRSPFRKYIDSSYSEKTFKVKLNNLPYDLTLQNLNKMMIGWGRIGDIKLRQNRSSSYALIDFFDRFARDYFIEALDGTPMGFMILNVTR